MFPVIRRIKNIYKAECRTILHDKGIALIMIGAVCLYSLVYMIPYHNHIARDVPVGIIDNDNTSLSRKVVRSINAHEMIAVTSKPNTLEQAKQEYYQDKVKAYIEIPKDFERNIQRGQASFLSVYLDSSYLVIYKQVATGLNEVVGKMGAAIEINSLIKKGHSKNRASSIKSPFETITVPLYNPTSSYQNYIYPQVLAMILQQTLLMGITLLMGTLYENLQGIRRHNKEKKLVYIKQRYVSQFSDNPAEIVLGKGLAYFSFYYTYTFIFYFIIPNFITFRTLYNYDMMIFAIPFILAIAFMGITFSIFCKSRESGMFVLVPSSVPFIFLSGFV